MERPRIDLWPRGGPLCWIFEPHVCAEAAQLSLLQPTVIRNTVFKFSLNVQFVSPSLLVFAVWSPSFLSREAQGGPNAALALEVLGGT